MEDIYKLVGKRILEERKAAGLTQVKLGRLAKTHYSFLGYVERAKKKMSLQTLQKIASALNIPASKLLSTARPKKTPEKEKLLKRLSAILEGRSKKQQEFVVDLVDTILEKMDKKL